MKTHAKSLAIGGILTPIALLLATLIANEGQTLLGLELDQKALALYLAPFLLAAGAAIYGLLKLEASKVASELGLGGLLGDLGGLLGGAPGPGLEAPKGPPPPPGPPGMVTPPPPSPPPSP